MSEYELAITEKLIIEESSTKTNWIDCFKLEQETKIPLETINLYRRKLLGKLAAERLYKKDFQNITQHSMVSLENKDEDNVLLEKISSDLHALHDKNVNLIMRLSKVDDGSAPKYIYTSSVVNGEDDAKTTKGNNSDLGKDKAQAKIHRISTLLGGLESDLSDIHAILRGEPRV